MPITNLMDLPDEVLLRVLRYTQLSDYGRLSVVSKQWQRCVDDEAFWKAKVHQDLTRYPKLYEGQTYKDYYCSVYTSNTLPNYAAYLKASKNKPLPKNEISRYLSIACQFGAEVLLQSLIQQGASITERHIQFAIENGQTRLLEVILAIVSNEILNSSKEDFSMTLYSGFAAEMLDQTLLHYAAESDYFEAALPVLLTNSDRITVLPELHKAAACGDVQKLIQLLAQGANAEALDYRKCKPLWWAIVCGQESCVRVLLSRRVNLSQISVGKHRSALMVALWRKKGTILELLIRGGANILEEVVTDKFHPVPLNALHIAAKYDFVEGLNLLINQNLPVNHQRYTFSPLHMAAMSGSESCVRLLLERGSMVDRKDMWIDLDEDRKDDTEIIASPLYFAATGKHYGCVNLLLIAGANPALAHEHIDIHKEKLRMSNVKFVLHDLVAGLGASDRYENIKLISRELKKSNYSPDDSSNPTSYAFISAVERIVRYGVDLNVQDESGRTIIMNLICPLNVMGGIYRNAAIKSNLNKFINKCLEIMTLDSRLNINLADKYQGQTALHLAVIHLTLPSVKILTEKGKADIHQKDKYGNTALLLAVMAKKITIIAYLLERGASLADKNNQGETIESIAAKSNDDKLSSFLDQQKERLSTCIKAMGI